MFVLVLDYVAPLEEVDRHMSAHVAWLKRGFDEGPFVVAGRQAPRTGGIIVARGDDRALMEALAATDPFVTQGVATCTVIAFNPSFVAAGFEALKA